MSPADDRKEVVAALWMTYRADYLSVKVTASDIKMAFWKKPPVKGKHEHFFENAEMTSLDVTPERENGVWQGVDDGDAFEKTEHLDAGSSDCQRVKRVSKWQRLPSEKSNTSDARTSQNQFTHSRRSNPELQ